MKTFIIIMGIFLAIILIMVAIRSKAGSTFEIKNSDILIALIPIAFWLILTGKVKVIEFGGFKIESAFVAASKAAIDLQVEALPVEDIQMETKGGVGEIDRLIEKKTEALTFYLGRGGYYYGPAIDQYLQKLTAYPFFKYIVILENDGRFFGLVDARGFYSVASMSHPDFSIEDFAVWLNRDRLENLKRLPGFIGAEYAIQKESDKRSALKMFGKLNVPNLPVMDESGKIVGIVGRERLAASLIVEVAERVE